MGPPTRLALKVGGIWVWVKLNHEGTAGFAPCFHFPGFHFGTLFLSHNHILARCAWGCSCRRFAEWYAPWKLRGRCMRESKAQNRALCPQQRNYCKQRMPAEAMVHAVEAFQKGRQTEIYRAYPVWYRVSTLLLPFQGWVGRRIPQSRARTTCYANKGHVAGF